MAGKYQIIDEKTWKRAVHCQIFRNYVEPQYCVTFELDVTRFRAAMRQKGLSFTMALIHTAAACANGIEAFRHRFLDGQVVLYDRIDTAFTYMEEGDELFKVVRVGMMDRLEDYVAVALDIAKAQKDYFTGPLGNDVFQFSPLPWISYTHVSHTIPGKKDNATPLIDWGKYFERDGKTLLPFSVQAHHSFVDGIHIGRLADSLQRDLNAF